MLCPGLSQNTKHHQLTLYKGQVRRVWREKSYLDLCNQNVLNIVHDPRYVYNGDIIEKNGELYVPPVPGRGFLWDHSQASWDSEILQSFTDLTKTTSITFFLISQKDSLKGVRYQIIVTGFQCILQNHHDQCVPPTRYKPKFIWTKEGLKTNENYLS